MSSEGALLVWDLASLDGTERLRPVSEPLFCCREAGTLLLVGSVHGRVAAAQRTSHVPFVADTGQRGWRFGAVSAARQSSVTRACVTALGGLPEHRLALAGFDDGVMNVMV